MDQRIDLTIEQVYQLHERIERQAIEPADLAVFGTFVSNLLVKYEARMARLSAKAAAAAAAEAATANNDVAVDVEPTATGGEEDEGCEPGVGGTVAPPTVNNDKDAQKMKAPGHGRNGAAAYTNAAHFFHALAGDVVGSRCPCGAGPLHNHRETTTIRIVGQPIFGAEAHHYQQARCRSCGRVARARGPEHVTQGIGKSVVYDYSACAMLIVMHYFGGQPFKRMESFHESWGTPLPDASQWEVASQSDGLLRPLFDLLERVGMQTATSLTTDDTGSMVISIKRQINAEIAALEKLGESTKAVRNGINATGVRLETPQGIVILYFTGLHHAGEIFARLMKHREPLAGPLVKATDGASKNFAHGHKDNLVEAICNAHAYLKFEAIKDKYPVQYAVAGEVYGSVFANDTAARERGMTPEARMAHHAKHSKPLMEKLREMCLALVRDKLVEPNSALWEPVSFIINQWSRLTTFYQKPDVPLHTNLVEQLLITPVRYLAGSFNYQTANGAGVGDRHMSLIASARANGIEPVAYIEYCLRNHEDLAKRPEYYLPWVYRDRLDDQAKPRSPLSHAESINHRRRSLSRAPPIQPAMTTALDL